MTSGRMCGPEDITERIEPGSFEKFRAGGIDVYVERKLLTPGEVAFTIQNSGEFALRVSEGPNEKEKQ